MVKGAVTLCLILTPLTPLCSHALAQEAGEKTGRAAGEIAPPTTREVVAEGRAAIGVGGVPGARKAAETIALRHAVEQAIGVFVSGSSLSQNYALVRDQVVTRASGFATLKEVLKEEVGADSVMVTVRALVSLRPLAEQLKELKLTRAWRCYVAPSLPGQGRTDDRAQVRATLTPAIAALERSLADAGFVVVSRSEEADIALQLVPRFATVSEQAIEAGNLPMTMYSVRGDMTLRATRAGTGEVVASLTGAKTALHINRDTARSHAAEDAITDLAPRLTEALLVLPAAHSQPVTLVVSGFAGIRQVGELEDALQTLQGVRQVTRRSYTGGVAAWELDVLNEAAPTLSRSLEEAPMLETFLLRVSGETRAKITAKIAQKKP